MLLGERKLIFGVSGGSVPESRWRRKIRSERQLRTTVSEYAPVSILSTTLSSLSHPIPLMVLSFSTLWPFLSESGNF